MEQLKEAKDFKNFDPEWYMQYLLGSDEAVSNISADVDELHRIFNECKSKRQTNARFGKYKCINKILTVNNTTKYGCQVLLGLVSNIRSQPDNVSGKRLLDVGTGPTVHTVIPARRHVDEIFLSDYVPQNLQYLERWHKGEINHPVKMIDYVLSLEGGTKTAGEVESELRQKVKGILPIDVRSAQPLGNFNGDTQFDVIISSYCIETAVLTVDEYRKCLENISTLLKKGGYLILFVCLNGNNYTVGDYRYRALSISKDEVEATMHKVGFDVKVGFEAKETEYDKKSLSFDSYYVMLATK